MDSPYSLNINTTAPPAPPAVTAVTARVKCDGVTVCDWLLASPDTATGSSGSIGSSGNIGSSGMGVKRLVVHGESIGGMVAAHAVLLKDAGDVAVVGDRRRWA